jgi:hypothetical protein
MTHTFIPTLSRNPLYCVWIETGNPAHPLDRVWIDPELRSFVDVEKAAPIHATNDECELEASAEPLGIIDHARDSSRHIGPSGVEREPKHNHNP